MGEVPVPGERGLAAYRLRVPVEREGRHRLVFDGVHHWCRIHWDGRPLREHAGGFTAFTADVEFAEAGTAELVVLVDNRIGPTHRCTWSTPTGTTSAASHAAPSCTGCPGPGSSRCA